MSHHIPQTDRPQLDEIVGRALLDPNFRMALLRKSARSSVLDYARLSKTTYAFLMSLDDMPELPTLAERIYDCLYCENGGSELAMD